MRQRGLSVQWVRGLLEALGTSGLDTDSLSRDAGLDLSALERAGQDCPTEKISLLWQLAQEKSGDPAIGLASQNTVLAANFGVVGYAMMSSADLLSGMNRLIRFMRIVSDATTLTIETRNDRCEITLEIFGGSQPLPRQRFESALLITLTFCRWVAGSDLKPLFVDLAYPAPAKMQPYQDAYRCPVRFNALTNRIVFASADMTQPLPTANPMMADMLDRFAGQKLEQLETSLVSFSVRNLITRSLPDGEPVRADIAKSLCVSERTLQRQLQAEGASFHQLLDQTRHELAQRYLAQAHISLAEVTYLLGFAEQSNFTRACKRWFNLPPSVYRRKVAQV